MESSESSTPQKTHKPTKNRTKNHDPRRFTDEQIKSLESIFAQETKLEPGKKMQLARDLSLHPRQVAIWFQNKRARWKSKRIEQEFTQLKSSYDALSIRFDDLKREKQSLQMQLQEVNDRLKNRERDDSRVNEVRTDDDRIITSGFKRTEDQEFLTCGEEMMSQTWRDLSDSGSLLFDESSEINPNWWES